MVATKISQGRGRPRSFDPEAAVGVAQKLFHARGYDGLSVAEIGEALGIRPPSFYAAFGSKAGLFSRVLDRYQAEQGGWAPEALAGAKNPADGIARLFARAAEVYANCDGQNGCLVLDSTRNSAEQDAVAMTDAIKAEARQLYVDYFEPTLSARAGELADSVMIGLAAMSAAARDGKGEAELARFGAILARGFADELA